MYGEYLKEQRKLNNETLESLSKKTGISKQNMSRWERNEVEPTIRFCVMLADFYGITLDELIGREVFNESKTQVNNLSYFNNSGTIKF